MAWYNPMSWFKKKEESKPQIIKTTIPPETTAVRSVDIVKTSPTGKVTGGVAVTTTGKGAWEGKGKVTSVHYGGGVSRQQAEQIATSVATTPSAISTTANTGTGYNPATRVQEGMPSIKPPAVVSAFTGQEVIPFQTQLTWKERLEKARQQFNLFDVGAGLGLASLFSFKTWSKPSYKFTIPQKITMGGEFKIDTKQQYETSKLLTGGMPFEAYYYYTGERAKKQTEEIYQPKLEEYTKGLQIDIDIGNISYEKATKQLETYQENLQKEAQTSLIESYRKQTYFAGKEYDYLAKYRKARETNWGGLISTGALIGGSLVSPTIATGISAGFVGMGTSKITTGIAGSELPILKRLSNIGIGTLMATTGIYGFSRGVIEPLRSQITMAEIRSALETIPQFYGGEIKLLQGGKIQTTYKGWAKSGGALRTTTADITSIPIESSFKIPQYIAKGDITHLVQAYEFGTSKPIQYIAGAKLYGVGGTYPIPSGNIYSSLMYTKTMPRWEALTKFKTLDISNAYTSQIKLYYGVQPQKNLIWGLVQQQQKNIWQLGGRITRADITTSGLGIQFTPEQVLKLKLMETPKEFIKGGLSPENFASRITSQVIQRPTFISQEILKTTPTIIIPTKEAITPFINLGIREKERVKIIAPPIIKLATPTITQQMITLPLQKQKTFSFIGSGIRQVELQKPISKIISPPSIVPPTFKPSLNYPSLRLPFLLPPFPKLNFEEGLGIRRYKGKPKYKYVPSWEALVFKLKGKKPKGIETGVRIRPITKEFSFAFKESPIKFKMPQFNFGFIKKKRKK